MGKAIKLVLLLAMSLPCTAQKILTQIQSGSSFPALTTDVVVPMNTSTPGTTLTDTIATAGTISPSITYFWASPLPNHGTGNWQVGSGQSGCSNLGPVVVNGGSTYAAGALAFNSMQFPNSVASFNWEDNAPEEGGVTNVSWLGCISFDFPPITGGSFVWDLMRIDSVNGQSSIINCQFGSSFSPFCKLEVDNAIDSPNQFSLVTPGTYWFSMNLNMVNGVANVDIYDTSGNHLINMTATNTTLNPGDTMNIGRMGNSESGTSGSGNVFFQNMMWNWTTHPQPFFW